VRSYANPSAPCAGSSVPATIQPPPRRRTPRAASGFRVGVRLGVGSRQVVGGPPVQDRVEAQAGREGAHGLALALTHTHTHTHTHTPV
jgi:hypothetical protein